MASKDKVATKHSKPDPQDKRQEHRHFKKSNPQVFKKINSSELPVIGINSGGNISHIKMALITYCQKELGPISKMFTEMAYQKEITVPFDSKDLSDKNDPLGIYKARIIGRMKQACRQSCLREVQNQTLWRYQFDDNKGSRRETFCPQINHRIKIDLTSWLSDGYRINRRCHHNIR
jgi:hypothetical protein